MRLEQKVAIVTGGGSGFGFTGSNPGALHGGHHPVTSYNTC